jgi:hypothetical protein
MTTQLTRRQILGIAAFQTAAALGITEETDAVAVVVSEESGTISVAFDGVMVRDLDGKSLRNALYKYLVTDLYPRAGTS